MEIRQFEAFVAIAETGSFTAAGERVSLTQSTVSQQIKALEEELGEALFVRGGRGVRLTDAGEHLLPKARLILDALDEIGATFKNSGRTTRGRLRVGAASMATAYLFAPLYERFIATHPAIQLLVRSTATTEETLRQVVSGEIDVGFIAVPVSNASLVVEVVTTDEVVLVVGPAHPWSGRSSVDPLELDGQPMVAFERGMSHRRTMDTLFAEIGVSPRIVSETNDPQMVKSLIEIGLGIALIPKWAVAREVATGRLHVLTLGSHRLERDVNMIYLKRHTSSVRAFTDFCRQFKSTIGSGAATVIAD
ncbi:MAG: LysR family transcriptional regulator [Blastocatellia bacterium]|nr:LysR family transcriptional regulator [Blastocatellia bacterium]